jgi:uncharacterized protein (DUF2267 family)
MNHDEFVGQVQARARFGSRGDAERAIRATLETLAERLDGGFAENMAAQLPSEIARHLKTDAPFERITLDEFFHRVLQRESEDGHRVDLPEATYHARVVMEVLQTAVTQGTIEKLRTQLPAEFEPLLSVGSEGRMRVEGGADSRPPRE